MVNNKKKVFFSCILFQLVLLANIFTVPNESFTIKVGYTQIEGFLYKNENDELSGLAYELFSELASLSNWNCEYVECSYSELQANLEKGVIDIFFPYKKTPDREKNLEYSKAIFCKCEPSLHTSENRDIFYNDFEHMDNIVIGIPSQISDDKSIKEFLARYNCDCELKTNYSGQKDLLSALYRGEIDSFISPINSNLSLCRKIATLDIENFYVVAKKGNTKLLDRIDYSLNYIQSIKPFVINELQSKYYLSGDNSYPPLDRREHELIQNKKRVTVLISANECDSNGQFDRTAKSLFDKLTILTKLEFIPVIKQTTSELLEAIKNNEADTIYSFENNYQWANENNVLLTKPYITVENLFISKPKVINPKKIGVITDSFEQKHSKFNEVNLVTLDSYKQGFDLIKKGKIDGLYCPSPVGNYYSLSYKYKSLSYSPLFDNKISYCLAVSKQADNLLVNVLNKAMLCVPDNYISGAFGKQLTERKLTLMDYVLQKPALSILIIVCLNILIVYLVFLKLHSKEIEKKNIELAQANQSKIDFFGKVSHDMRTPLNVLLGLINIAKKQEDVARIKGYFAQMAVSSNYLLKLINDALTMNKIEAGKLDLHLEPTNSYEVLQNIIENAKLLTKVKGIELELSYPDFSKRKYPLVITDGPRIEQVAMNVVANAVKFTPRGGKIFLGMEIVSMNSDMVVDKFVVRDNGIGISKEFLPHIFEPFSQEGRGDKNPDEGTGLGLSIVKQLMILLNGKIEVKSEINKGTEVVLYLSYRFDKTKYSVTTKKTGKPEINKLIGKNVLLCEDHPMNAEIVINLLEDVGCNVVYAKNGQEAVTEFTKSEISYFDIILMDIRMPILNGLEATMAIRALPRFDSLIVPIIALTANSYQADVQKSFDSGMNAHLEKPISPQALFNTMIKFLPD